MNPYAATTPGSPATAVCSPHGHRRARLIIYWYTPLCHRYQHFRPWAHMIPPSPLADAGAALGVGLARGRALRHALAADAAAAAQLHRCGCRAEGQGGGRGRHRKGKEGKGRSGYCTPAGRATWGKQGTMQAQIL